MFEQKIQQKPKMNLTPLIDIIFLLVVFFMLSTSFVKIEALNMFVAKEESSEAPQNLSLAQKAVQSFNNSQVSLSINSSGIELNGMRVSELSLLTELQSALENSAQNGKLKIFVGEGINVQKLVEIVDIAQMANAKDVEIVSSE